LIVRSGNGRVIRRDTIPEDGRIGLTLCDRELDEAAQIEVTMPVGDENYVGVLTSFSKGRTGYCLVIPSIQATHCT